MNAETVHIVAKSLPPEELHRFYVLIQKEMAGVKTVAKKTKTPIISASKSMEDISNSLNETKRKRFAKEYEKKFYN